jgi:hypothetical protein
MMRFLKNLFLTSEERHITRVVAETGSTAAIAVVRSVPMAGFVERLQFERMSDRIVVSTAIVRGNAKEQTAAVDVSLAAFDTAIDLLGTACRNLTAADMRGLKDGESYLIVWAAGSRPSRLFVRWPVNNELVRQVLDTLLPRRAPTSDSPRQAPRG